MTDAAILPLRSVAKVWGRQDLPPPFDPPAQGEPIGEIWFESPPELSDILVKYLFTSDKLSVQVHPSDAQAQEGEDGKEECWLILDAEPGARLAIGFRDNLSSDAMRAAAIDGSIEDLLEWHEVEAGDFFYLPPGTVHAIGAGISLIEVQQSSETTFRLYDYGRPRNLHLDRAIAVAEGKAHPAELRTRVVGHSQLLVTGPHFQLGRLLGAPEADFGARFDRPVMVLPLAGEVELDSEPVGPGQCGFADNLARFTFSSDAISLIVSSA